MGSSVSLKNLSMVPNWVRKGEATLQEDLDCLEEWASKNPMKFNKDKCKVLLLKNYNPGLQHRLECACLGNSFMERDLGVLVGNKFRMSDQCAAGAEKASRRLGCISQGILSRDQKDIISLYSAHA